MTKSSKSGGTTKGKFSWISRQTAKGWRLALEVGNKRFNVKGLLLKGTEDVERVTSMGAVKFFHMGPPREASKSKSVKKAAPSKSRKAKR